MEEKNTKPVENKQKSTDKKSERKSLVEFFKEVRGEFRKIIWPNRKELIKLTMTVIVTSLLVGLIVSLMDVVFAWGYQTILGLLG